MFIRIDPNRALPIFSQIMEGVRLAVATGRIVPGERIPSIRDLAVETRVNPNTVAKAYQELERAGIVEVRRGMGYFVVGSINGQLSDRERMALLESRVEETLSAALELGFEPEEVKAAIDRLTNLTP
jgi:GntR family transcriptional regulator